MALARYILGPDRPMSDGSPSAHRHVGRADLFPRLREPDTRMLLQIVIAAGGGLVAMAFMILSPIGPAAFLAAVSPFDALFSSLFGMGGNLVTYLPLLALMMKVSPGGWLPAFFGSRIQQFFFAFLLALSISHLLTVAVHPQAAVLEYLRKFTLFMVVGIWAWFMRSGDDVLRLNRILVVSTVVYTLISMADFYLGIGVLPGVEATEGVYGRTLEETPSEHSLRYRAGALPINRTANWLIVPSFLAFGWLMLSRNTMTRAVALFSTVVCVTGIFATVGRSAIAATVLGFLVLIPTAIGMKPKRILGAVAVLAIVGSVGLLTMWQLGFLDLIETRFVGERSEGAGVARLNVYAAALRIWMTSPVIGVGDAMMAEHPLFIGVTAHNSFLGLLAEAGLVGLLPYLALTILIIMRFVERNSDLEESFDAWRPYFFAGWVASMFQNMFNEYTWERFIWYAVAYLIARERLMIAARVARAREAFAAQASFGSPAPGESPAGASPI